MSTIKEAFKKGQGLLKEFPQPSVEARLLLLKAASISEEKFHSSPEAKLSRKEERQFYKLISRRKAGFPLAYLTGIKEFWSIPFRVEEGIFIPRPETELMVEKVVELSGGENGKNETIVDIGTGCGSIAVSLAKELPDARITATDNSRKALKLARLNASRQQVSNITFVRGSLFAPLKKRLEKKCDFIVSNPPYVSEREWKDLSPEIKNHESKQAVVAGGEGLEFIQQLILGAPVYLKPGGYLIIEIGEGQKETVLSLFGDEWSEVKSYNDLNKIPRLVTAQI